VTVLVSTSGFAVFKHSCQTEQTTEYSIMMPEFDCEHEQSIQTCCTIPENDGIPSCAETDCCDTDTYHVKLDIPLDAKDHSKKTGSVITGLSETVVSISNDVIVENSPIISFNDLPPPKSGKDLRIFLNQLNIPPITV
jgi:hypothetical protein